MNNAIKTKLLGQSIWYDNIDRADLENGAMRLLIEQGKIYGVTSNPSIFEKSIGQGQAYDLSLQAMSWAGLDTEQIYFELVKQDIQMTADLFSRVYEDTDYVDGYVSVEIDPMLANDTEKSISEGKMLWARINRKNLMIKVPATKAGMPVIRALIAEGINVNATLIFAIDQYLEVMNAYLSGLEERVQKGLPIERIHSVASFFVSRIDTAVDNLLKEKIDSGLVELELLQGKIAVDNARMAYQAFKKYFNSDRFEKLAQKGAQIQRPLWASTGTKNPKYSDCLYVDELIGSNTVNTIPTATLHAFLEHGRPDIKIDFEIEESKKRLASLTEAGVDFSQVTKKLEDDGVLAFQKAHQSLLATIERKRKQYANEIGSLGVNLRLAMKTASEQNYLQRLFEHDPSLWTNEKSEFEEIRNRLGWLGLPGTQFTHISEYEAFLKEILEEGFTDVFVLGMGGSSLSPEVMAQSFQALIPEGQGLKLCIIDTTNPIEIKAQCDAVNLEKTLFIVSSKSGGTAETMAAFKYFREEMASLYPDTFGSRFVAITDPGSTLGEIAKRDCFRAIFYAPANVGGRFSAFTPFGLVPAALIGIDLSLLLNKADFSDRTSQPKSAIASNSNLMLGLILGAAANAGRNKLTFIAEDFAANLVPWLEQLIAESTGKDGKGILPIEGEPVLKSLKYPEDRLFVYFEVDKSRETFVESLREKGCPVLVFKLHDPYDLAREFYRWEYATAIASAVIGVNAFNQPDVQSTKLVTNTVIEKYKKEGSLDMGKPIYTNNQFKVYGQELAGIEDCASLDDLLEKVSETIKSNGYIAINAFLPRLPNEIEELQAFRSKLLNHFNVATALGFGPRFLHSTGQFHKGGPVGGLYLIFTREILEDLEIPGENMSFGTLQLAQALGDFGVLRERGKSAYLIELSASKD